MHNKWVVSMDDFKKDIPAEGVVIPFPTLDKVKFYRNHLQRSMAQTLELYGEYVSVQDNLVSQIIECENSMLELSEELNRLEKVLSTTLAKTEKEVQDASKI